MTRVAVLLDEASVDHWVARCLQTMVDRTDAEVTHVVINDKPGKTASELLRRAIQKPHWARWFAGMKLLRAIAGPPDYMRAHSLDSLDALADARVIRAEPVPLDGFGNRLPTDVVDTIGEEADLVFRHGFGVLKGDVLTEPPLGVLSYHHGDPSEYRGSPAGLWEFLDGVDTAGIMLQQLTETLDGGRTVVYDEVDVEDAQTFRQVQRRLYRNSPEMLATAVERLTDPDFEPETPADLAPVNTAPGIVDYCRYQLKNSRGRLRSGHL
jgi:folate-dependent phosphoribosylglycinamide formyltransferase PurN